MHQCTVDKYYGYYYIYKRYKFNKEYRSFEEEEYCNALGRFGVFMEFTDANLKKGVNLTHPSQLTSDYVSFIVSVLLNLIVFIVSIFLQEK